jgi:hypothetical protein
VEAAVDVQEISKLDAYLKRLFGDPRLRVVPRPKTDAAEVYLAEEFLGVLTVDDEDEERSYNLRMEVPVGMPGEGQDAKKLDVYLKRRFNNERIRVVARPRKTDSVEAYVGEEFIGVLFKDDAGGKSYIFEVPILGMDLE